MSAGGFSLTLLLGLTIGLALIHPILARVFRLRVGVGEIAGVAVAGGVIAFVMVGALNAMTDGRGAPHETTPWVVLSVLGGDLLWMWLRSRSGATRAGRGAGASASAEVASSPTVPVEPSSKPPLVSPPQAAVQPVESRPPARTRTIFVSYRRADSAATTGRISDHLFQSFGREAVMKDVDSIPLGVDYRKHIDSMVSRCDILIAVIGRRWIDAEGEDGRRRLENPRDLVRLEIEVALDRDIPVIPLLVDSVRMPDEDDLPEALRPLAFRNGIPVRPDPDFRNDMRRLIAGLEEHFGGSADER